MKNNVKKLLSILTALALLVSVALPAGVLPAFAAETGAENSADPEVIEILFQTDTDAQHIKYGFGKYYSADHASGYRVRLDYYLPESATLTWENGGAGGTYTGDTSFKPGHHTMDFTCISTRADGAYFPRLAMSARTTDLYIWNFEISCNGEVLSKKESDGNSSVYVSASSTKVLSEYDWSTYMDTPLVTEIPFATTDAQHPKYGFGEHYSADYASGYRVKFDYYLPENATPTWDCNTTTGMSGAISGDTSFKTGHHTMDFTCISTQSGNKFFPRIVMNDRTTDLYIWNVEISCNGVVLTKKSDDNPTLYVTASSTKRLGAYDWYEYMDTPLVTVIPFETDTSVSNIKYGFGQYYSPDHASGYRVKFDYYLPESATLTWENGGEPSASTYIGDTSFKSGRHTMDFTCISSRSGGDYFPRLKMSARTTDLYIWNFEISCNGVVLSKAGNDTSSNVYVKASPAKVLGAYDWSKYIKIKASEMTWSGDGKVHLFRDTAVKTDRTKANGWTLTFDYYLPKEAAISVAGSNANNTVSAALPDATTNSSLLQPGTHTFSSTFQIDTLAVSTALQPVLYAYYSDGYSEPVPDVYIWNWKLTSGNGIEVMMTDTAGFAGDAATGGYVEAIPYSRAQDEMVAVDDTAAAIEIDFSEANYYTDTTGTNRLPYAGITTWHGSMTSPQITFSFDYYLADASVTTQAFIGYYYANTGAYACAGTQVLSEGLNTLSLSAQLNEKRHIFLGVRQGDSGNPTAFTAGTKLIIWNVTCQLTADIAKTAFTGDDLIAGMEWFTQDGAGVVMTSDVAIPVNTYHFDFDNEGIDRSFVQSATNFLEQLYFRPHGLTMGGASTGSFTYSFEYYMPEQSPIYVCHGNVKSTILPDKDTGTGYLQQGHHTYSFTFNVEDYSGEGTLLGFATSYNPYADDMDGARDGKLNGKSLLPGDLYVWNLKLTNNSTGTVKTSYGTSNQGIAANYMYSGVALDPNTFVDKTDVYSFDFKTADAETFGHPFGYLRLKQAIDISMRDGVPTEAMGNEYTISFDYFLPETDAQAYAFFDATEDFFANVDGGTSLRNIAEGENNDNTLEAGRHTFKAVITRDMIGNTGRRDVYLRFGLNYGYGTVLSKLYVWNVKFYCSNGTDAVKGNLVEGMPPVGHNYTEASMTSIPTASLDTEVELDMYGAQIRSDYALRFIAAIKGADVTRKTTGEAQYDDTATITIGDVTYTVTGAGVLFGRGKRIASVGVPELALTVEKVQEYPNAIYNIPAVKLQSEEYHGAFLGDADGVVYTGVIKNIPRANWGETLNARAYMQVVDANGVASTIYGDVISRSLSDINISTQPNNLNPNEKLQSTDEMEEAAAQFKAENFGDGITDVTGISNIVYVDSTYTGGGSDGSLAKPYTTLAEVNGSVSAGTKNSPKAVLFKRGGEYRGQLLVKDYTTYGAYGDLAEPKPLINGSQQDYSKIEIYDSVAAVPAGKLGWVNCGEQFGNRWQLVNAGTYFTNLDSSDTEVGNNVGNMYFFDKETGEMIAYGSKSMQSDIYQDYEFHHAYAERTFYPEDTEETNSSGVSLAGAVQTMTLGDLFVYLPGKMTPDDFGKIEIVSKMSIIVGKSTEDSALKNIHIDNLCLKYTGVHGISFSSGVERYPVSNVTVKNCEIGWIGGSTMRYNNNSTDDYTDDLDVRLGNGIEFYGNCDDVTVQNNWIYQCYDAGYSNQGTSAIAQNVTVTGNLIEYCAYSIEIWMNTAAGLMEDCRYDGNFMRFAGYEFERDNRIGGSLTAISHVNFMNGAKPCNNVTVNDNIFDTSYASMLVMGYPNSTDKNTENDGEELDAVASIVDAVDFKADVTGATVKGNTWVQGYDQHSDLAYLWVDKDSPENTHLAAGSQKEMNENISKIDLKAEKVVFYK